MILVYRPELESPPMDKECTIGFSFITGKGTPENISVKAGVTRDFPEEIWKRIQNYDVVKNLLSLGALRVEAEDSADIAESASPETASDPNSIANLDLAKALRLIEDSFDVDQLRRWHEKEARIKVRNSIHKRITAITEGNG